MYIIDLAKTEDMKENKILNYIKAVLKNMPEDWLKLTTHRLDIYKEKLAKTQFLDQFEVLYNKNNFDKTELLKLPTAYDYIRLGHPLSSILEWGIAKLNGLDPENVISFQSKTIPILAILRKNLLDHKKTQILYTDNLPKGFDIEVVREVYGHQFELKKVETASAIPDFDGSTIFIAEENDFQNFNLSSSIDFFINLQAHLGSVLLVNGVQNENYISAIQHVRRRETISMTPANSLEALNLLAEKSSFTSQKENSEIEINKPTPIEIIETPFFELKKLTFECLLIVTMR